MLLANAIEMFIKFYLFNCVFAWIHHTEFDLIHGDSHYYEKWFDIDDHKIYLNKGRVQNTTVSILDIRIKDSQVDPAHEKGGSRPGRLIHFIYINYQP